MKYKAKVTVVAGQMNHLDVVLNAGVSALRAKRTADENPEGRCFLASPVPERRLALQLYDPETSTITAAGRYTVSVTIGAAKVTREVEIVAGDTTVVEIVAGVGRLQGSIESPGGGPALRDPFIEIFAYAEPVENRPRRPTPMAVRRSSISRPASTTPASSPMRSTALSRWRSRRAAAGYGVRARRRHRRVRIAGRDGGAGDQEPGRGHLRRAHRHRHALSGPFPNFALPTGKYVAVMFKGDAKRGVRGLAGQRTVTRITVP